MGRTEGCKRGFGPVIEFSGYFAGVAKIQQPLLDAGDLLDRVQGPEVERVTLGDSAFRNDEGAGSRTGGDRKAESPVRVGLAPDGDGPMTHEK